MGGREKKKKAKCQRVSDASKEEQEHTVAAMTLAAPIISKRLLLSEILFSHYKELYVLRDFTFFSTPPCQTYLHQEVRELIRIFFTSKMTLKETGSFKSQ